MGDDGGRQLGYRASKGRRHDRGQPSIGRDRTRIPAHCADKTTLSHGGNTRKGQHSSVYGRN